MIFYYLFLIIFCEDLQAGELPTAFVVLKPNQKVSEEELVQFTNDRVKTHYKHLRGGVVFVDQIPKSPSGKVSFSALS